MVRNKHNTPFFSTPPLAPKALQSIPPCGAFAMSPPVKKGTPERPQTLRCPENLNHSSAENGQSSAEAIQNGSPAAADVTACSAGDPVRCP